MRKFYKVAAIFFFTVIIVLCIAIGYVKWALPNIPVEVVKIEPTPERIERGKYLANHVAVCMDCHSKREWNLFAGPMASDGIGGGGEVFNQEMGFPGAFYAPNITPYALSNWTDGELLRAVTAGVNKRGKALFPIMGYHRFGKMDKEDIYSVIAYIRTLAPVKNMPPASKADFPVNILINTFPEQAKYEPIPQKSDVKVYGKYLVNACGCVDCHSKTEKGTIIPGTEFGGGMQFKQPAGTVCSPNISPDKETGIGQWNSQSFVARFKIFAAKDYVPAKIGPQEMNTPMPWMMYSGMTDDDLSAIYTYLQTVKPIKNKVRIYTKA
jgi:mono/diheme cytochrome c family protein